MEKKGNVKKIVILMQGTEGGKMKIWKMNNTGAGPSGRAV